LLTYSYSCSLLQQTFFFWHPVKGLWNEFNQKLVWKYRWDSPERQALASQSLGRLQWQQFSMDRLLFVEARLKRIRKWGVKAVSQRHKWDIWMANRKCADKFLRDRYGTPSKEYFFYFYMEHANVRPSSTTFPGQLLSMFFHFPCESCACFIWQLVRHDFL
jgi:hypothetical protein